MPYELRLYPWALFAAFNVYYSYIESLCLPNPIAQWTMPATTTSFGMIDVMKLFVDQAFLLPTTSLTNVLVSLVNVPGKCLLDSCIVANWGWLQLFAYIGHELVKAHLHNLSDHLFDSVLRKALLEDVLVTPAHAIIRVGDNFISWYPTADH